MLILVEIGTVDVAVASIDSVFHHLFHLSWRSLKTSTIIPWTFPLSPASTCWDSSPKSPCTAAAPCHRHLNWILTSPFCREKTAVLGVEQKEVSFCQISADGLNLLICRGPFQCLSICGSALSSRLTHYHFPPSVTQGILPLAAPSHSSEQPALGQEAFCNPLFFFFFLSQLLPFIWTFSSCSYFSFFAIFLHFPPSCPTPTAWEPICPVTPVRQPSRTWFFLIFCYSNPPLQPPYLLLLTPAAPARTTAPLPARCPAPGRASSSCCSAPCKAPPSCPQPSPLAASWLCMPIATPRHLKKPVPASPRLSLRLLQAFIRRGAHDVEVLVSCQGFFYSFMFSVEVEMPYSVVNSVLCVPTSEVPWAWRMLGELMQEVSCADIVSYRQRQTVWNFHLLFLEKIRFTHCSEEVIKREHEPLFTEFTRPLSLQDGFLNHSLDRWGVFKAVGSLHSAEMLASISQDARGCKNRAVITACLQACFSLINHLMWGQYALRVLTCESCREPHTATVPQYKSLGGPGYAAVRKIQRKATLHKGQRWNPSRVAKGEIARVHLGLCFYGSS